MKWMPFIAPLFAVSISFAAVQSDSTDILFDDSAVHEYTLTFYASDWKTQLETNYTNDAGYIPAKFSDGKITIDSVGVCYKGNSSYNAAGTSPKKPFKIKFNEFISGQKYYGIKILNFSNNYGDPTFLREKIAYNIAAKYMHSPRSTFATITIGSELIGLYTQIEQIDKQFLGKYFTNDSLNLFKASDAGASLVYSGTDPSLYASQLELKTNEETNDWSGMIAFLNYINNSDSETFCSTYTNYMDPDNIAPFLAFIMTLSHFDSYVGSGRNFYLYQTNSDGYMNFLPWDLNLAFGGYSNGWDVYNQSAISTSNISDRPLFNQLMKCQDFQYKYLSYIKNMINTYASTDSIQKSIDQYVNTIQTFVEADPNKFYSLSDFSTNLTSKLRTASGSIPGLIEFSTTRNAFLLKELQSILPEDYEALRVSSLSSFRVSIYNGQIILSNISSNKRIQVEFFKTNGERLGVIQTSQFMIPIPVLPKGMILIRIQTQQNARILKYNNL